MAMTLYSSDARRKPICSVRSSYSTPRECGSACDASTSRSAPLFLRTVLPGLDPSIVTYVPHHVAHAASAHLAAPFRDSSVLVLDGRGERTSHLSARARGADLEVLASQALPHSLGVLYEDLTEHLGFRRASDEYKVMAMASYG